MVDQVGKMTKFLCIDSDNQKDNDATLPPNSWTGIGFNAYDYLKQVEWGKIVNKSVDAKYFLEELPPNNLDLARGVGTIRQLGQLCLHHDLSYYGGRVFISLQHSELP